MEKAGKGAGNQENDEGQGGEVICAILAHSAAYNSRLVSRHVSFGRELARLVTRENDELMYNMATMMIHDHYKANQIAGIAQWLESRSFKAAFHPYVNKLCFVLILVLSLSYTL